MKQASKKNKILIILLIVLAVVSLNFFQKEVKGFFYTISSSIQKTLWRAGSTNKELENLNLKNQKLLAEIILLQNFKEENEILREALGIGLQKDFRLAFADIIGKDIGQNSVLINQGSEDGLSEGMPVITQEKVLLGKISEVYEHFSRVSLISSKDSSFDAEISDQDVFGIIKGNGGQLLDFDFVSQDKEIKQGDLVVSVSLGGIYPKGLLVGLVREVEESDTDPFYKIKVSSFFNLGETDNVLVILDF